MQRRKAFSAGGDNTIKKTIFPFKKHEDNDNIQTLRLTQSTNWIHLCAPPVNYVQSAR